MALVSHTIVSRYTPQQRDPITEPVELEEDLWRTESSFGLAQRLHSRPAPYFVAASLAYDEYGMPRADAALHPEKSKGRDAAEDVSAWYRSLTGKGRARQDEQEPSVSPPPNTPRNFSPDSSSLRSIAEVQPSSNGALYATRRPNWFSRTLPPDLTQPTSKPSTLADLLSRNPPPLPSEPAFKPPVFLTLGPSNKGFTMLQRKGWQEGEGLGSGRVERKPREGLGMKKSAEDAFKLERDAEEWKLVLRRPGRTTSALIEDANREVIDLTLDDSNHGMKHDVVDLTLSDSESESDVELDDLLQTSDSVPEPHGTTLLTPIPTTLKADRLGIGLKAARRTSAKAKAVTHTSAALAAHIRSGNQVRKEKAQHGRGSRGFARSKREEERERLRMLAYLNS